MTEGATPGAPSDAAVLEELGRQLDRYFGRRCRITSFSRRPSAYRTSFSIDELEVGLAAGDRLKLIFKDLAWARLQDDVRNVKPRLIYDPHREIEVYRTVLPAAGLRAAVCYGAVADDGRERYWLFLEAVPGVELYQVGDCAIWEKVAAWLADAHVALMPVQAGASAAHLLEWTDRLIHGWLRRAMEFSERPGTAMASGSRRTLSRIHERFDDLSARLSALPRTIVHGEFYASNVLVEAHEAGCRVCPIDWEMSGPGPALLDLAALTSGHWSTADREAIVLAYYERARSAGMWVLSRAAFDEALSLCRVCLAIQWLGWSAHWSPPAEHRQDWGGVLVEHAGRLFDEPSGT